MFETSLRFSCKESEASFNSDSEYEMMEIAYGGRQKQDEYKEGSILKDKYEKIAEGKPLLNENEEIVIILTETETFTLLDFPRLSIGNNDDEHESQKNLNNK